MEKKQNTERNNKGGRPPKSTTDKLKYRVTVKLATPDYYTLKSRARSAGISASEYLMTRSILIYILPTTG